MGFQSQISIEVPPKGGMATHGRVAVFELVKAGITG